MGQKPADIPEDILRKFYLEEKLSQYQIAERLGCSQVAVWRRLKKYNIPLRSRAEANILFSKYERHDFDGDDQLKAYMLGFCKGDVHVWVREEKSQTIRLYTATTQIEQVRLFQRLFTPYGGVYVSKPDTRNALHMSAYVNRSSMSFLLHREDCIPDWILGEQETFFAFFAGYCDAEAHIGVHAGYAVFKVDSYDKNILQQSYEKMLQAGIIFPKPSICRVQGTVDSCGSPYRQDMWRLKTASKLYMMLLFDRIAPYLKHEKHIRHMYAAIENINSRNEIKRTKRNRASKHDENK